MHSQDPASKDRGTLICLLNNSHQVCPRQHPQGIGKGLTPSFKEVQTKPLHQLHWILLRGTEMAQHNRLANALSQFLHPQLLPVPCPAFTGSFCCSRIPKKGFVEVTELTDINYTSNLVRLRPGHMNVVLILSNSTKTPLLQKFALEVYTFTG